MKKSLFLIFILVFTALSLSAPVPEEVFRDQRYFEALYRNSPIGVAFVSKEGKFLSANTILCNFLGRSEYELKNITWQSITSEADLEADKLAADRVINGRDLGYTLFKQYRHKRGEPLWAKLTVQGIFNEDGGFEHFVSFIEPLANGYYFEAEIASKMEILNKSILELREIRQTSSMSSFLSENWKTLIPWFFIGVITIGSILFRIQSDSKEIKEMKKTIKERIGNKDV